MGYMNYEERLEVAKRLYELSNDEQKTALECIFPELCESEDEKVMEDIISLINEFWERIGSINPEYSSRSRMLTWLENQVEHKKFRDSIQVGDEVTRNRNGVIVNLSQLNRVAKKDEKQSETFTKRDVDDAFVEGMAFAKNELEKQGEQKPAEKVEPKFKVGDKIIKFSKTPCPVHTLTDDTICEVAEVHDTCYILNTKEGRIQEPFEWQDYYELVGQKPGWSKEDEIMIANIRDDLFCYQTKVRDEDHQLAEDIEKEINWFKSLKKRYTWKPSDEQMRALNATAGIVGILTPTGVTLCSLYKDLEKLKGE